MNKYCKNLLAIAAVAVLTTANISFAGQTKTTAKKNSGDDFQLTFSSVPFSTDPNSAFVRHTCAAEQTHKKHSKKSTK